MWSSIDESEMTSAFEDKLAGKIWMYDLMHYNYDWPGSKNGDENSE